MVTVNYKDINFDEFTKGFFVQETCPIYNRRKEKGRGFSYSHKKRLDGILRNYLLKEFSGKKLTDIHQVDLDRFLCSLISENKISGVSANYIAYTMRLILKEACRKGIVDYNFTDKYDWFKMVHKPKGILTKDEAYKLMKQENWESYAYLLINRIARYTGMRVSEVLALSHTDVKYHDGLHYILVSKGLDEKQTLTDTKNHRERIVPIPGWFYSELFSYKPHKDFWFIRDGENINYMKVRLRFKKALEKIGVSDEERRERNLTFHSWRHRYISAMTGFIPDMQLKLIVGHRGTKTTDHYRHYVMSSTPDILSKSYFKNIYEI